jgi:hypothetical protein
VRQNLPLLCCPGWVERAPIDVFDPPKGRLELRHIRETDEVERFVTFINEIDETLGIAKEAGIDGDSVAASISACSRKKIQPRNQMATGNPKHFVDQSERGGDCGSGARNALRNCRCRQSHKRFTSWSAARIQSFSECI